MTTGAKDGAGGDTGPPTSPRPALKWLAPVIVTLALALVFGPAFRLRLRLLADPLMMAGDARQQIVPFLRWFDPGTFPHDALGDYFLSAMPIGFRAIYATLARFVDPIALARWVPLLLLVPFLVALAAAGKRLAGCAGMFLAPTLALSCPLYVERMAGGLPRAFGYPLLAAAAAALVLGRATALAAIVVIAAAFYPSVAVPVGIALALVLLVYPARERGDAASWSFRRRVAVLAATAIVAAAVVLPSALTAKRYGRGLGPGDAIAYPELGPGGRYDPNDRAPFAAFVPAAITQARRALRGDGRPFAARLRTWANDRPKTPGLLHDDGVLDALLVALAAGTALLARRNAAARRLLALFAAAFLAYLVACAVAPYFYMPFRYVSYPIPLLTTILLPAAGAAIASRVRERCGLRDARGRAPAIGATLLAGLCLVTLGGRGNAYAGLTDRREHAPLYARIAELPKDALIAGWPEGVLDDVPYASRRQAFLTYEAHQAFNQGQADELRRRMRALAAAYFATDLTPIARLRDEFGVTHLLVDRRHFETPPSYFEPFTDEVRRAFDAGKAAGFEVPKHLGGAVIEDGEFAVLDLARLR